MATRYKALIASALVLAYLVITKFDRWTSIPSQQTESSPSRYDDATRHPLDNANRGSLNIENVNRGSPNIKNANRGSSNRENVHKGYPSIDNASRGSPNIEHVNKGSPNIENMTRGYPNMEIVRRGYGLNMDQMSRGYPNVHFFNQTMPHASAILPPKQLKEIRHIAFLKVHKAASSTVQNIFYRFGFQRNLSFVLPERGLHYISKRKWQYNSLLPPVIKNGGNGQEKYDILCNHAVFNHDKFRKLLYNDTIYTAIVRNPLDLFISSAYYYRYIYPAAYLKKIPLSNFISELIRYPRKYEPNPLQNTHTFNPMAMDFGFDFASIDQSERYSISNTAAYLPKLGQIFHLVMLVERFEESLVLMKRYLRWQLKDILFVKLNAMKIKANLTTANDLTKDDVTLFKQRNKHDIVIYDFFKTRFEKQFAAEEDIIDETDTFKTILKKVQEFCIHSYSRIHELVIEKTRWNEGFVVTKVTCKLMRKDVLTFFYMMCKRHVSMLQTTEKQ